MLTSSKKVSEFASEFVSESLLLFLFIFDAMSESDVWILSVSESVSNMDWCRSSFSCPPNSGDGILGSVTTSSVLSRDFLGKVFQ